MKDKQITDERQMKVREDEQRRMANQNLSNIRQAAKGWINDDQISVEQMKNYNGKTMDFNLQKNQIDSG